MATNGNGNGRAWQLAFWVVSVFFFVGIGTLTKYVVANEEKSTAGDEKLVEKIHAEDSELRIEFKKEISLLRTEQKVMRKETNESFTRVLVAIAEIKND